MLTFHKWRAADESNSPAKRAFHRRVVKDLTRRLKKKLKLHSTGGRFVKLTKGNKCNMKKSKNELALPLNSSAKGKKKSRCFDTCCVVCKKPCASPKGNFNANRVAICKREKCVLKRRTELQRERRKQMQLKLTDKPSKHNSRITANWTSRISSQNWKSGATLVPK